MAKIEIICPYCGNKMEIDYKPKKHHEIVCEMCGSLLSKDDLKNYTLDLPDKSSPVGEQSPIPSSFPQQTPYSPSPQPFPTNSSVGPQSFPSDQPAPRRPAAQKLGEGLPQSAFVRKMVEPFPRSQFVRGPVGPLPQKTTLQQALTQVGPISKPKGAIMLVFPQINQKLIIPPTQTVFYFGRNTVLRLIGPSQQYDLEWLNAISRIQMDRHNHVVREHFKIFRDKKGIFIQDDKSSWGTWVNGMQIKGLGPIPLKNGDLIELKLAKPGVNYVIPFVIHVVI